MGDNPYVSTGYGQVWFNLLKRWKKERPDWEFYHVGWQGRDRAHMTNAGFTQLPMGQAQYGYDTVVDNLLDYNPDFIVTLCDVGWQSGYVKPIFEARKRGWKGKWIAYTPVDTHSFVMTWQEIFEMPDVNVAMSKWGEKMMVKNGIHNVVRIDHGVDTKVFYPLPDIENIKKKIGLSNKFVVGFVGRNQKRKMLDRLIVGFSHFAKNKEDVILMLHTDQEPPQARQLAESASFVGWSIPYMQWKYKVKDKIKLTKGNLNIDVRQKINPENMNEIYNLMDVFCYPTGGEGFGLPAIECQSSGVPLLMAANTTGFELCKEKNLIKPLTDKYDRVCVDIGTNGVEFVYPDDLEIAKILDKYYKDWKEDKKLLLKEKKDAREKALNYSWDVIAPKWIELFEKEL